VAIEMFELRSRAAEVAAPDVPLGRARRRNLVGYSLVRVIRSRMTGH
jgi:hypothetical protein